VQKPHKLTNLNGDVNLSGNENKKLIRRWDSEREPFYYDILHVLQSTV